MKAGRVEIIRGARSKTITTDFRNRRVTAAVRMLWHTVIRDGETEIRVLLLVMLFSRDAQ